MQPGPSPPKQPEEASPDRTVEEASPDRTVDIVPTLQTSDLAQPTSKEESGSAGQNATHRTQEHLSESPKCFRRRAVAGVILEAVHQASFSSAQVVLVPSYNGKQSGGGKIGR